METQLVVLPDLPSASGLFYCISSSRCSPPITRRLFVPVMDKGKQRRSVFKTCGIRKAVKAESVVAETVELYDDDKEEEEEGEGEEEDDRKDRTRGRKRGGGSLRRCCQAETCTADLAEARPYHRRHRVCELHAKAPVVMVGGMAQRFCQQCSRFHELSEFDESKRSCRARLAGHSERRRKSPAESLTEGSSRGGSMTGTQSPELAYEKVDDRGRKIQGTFEIR